MIVPFGLVTFSYGCPQGFWPYLVNSALNSRVIHKIYMVLQLPCCTLGEAYGFGGACQDCAMCFRHSVWLVIANLCRSFLGSSTRRHLLIVHKVAMDLIQTVLI